MQTPSIKNLRRILFGIIALMLIAVITNYSYTWRRRAQAIQPSSQILSVETTRSAEGVEYSGYQSGLIRYRIKAKKVVENRQGKNILQDIAINFFNPDGSVRNQIFSRNADYDPEANLAYLYEKVRLILGDNEAELTTNSLRYDMNAGIGTTSELIKIQSETVNGEALGVKFDENHNLLELNDKVNLQFSGKAKPGATASNFHVTTQHASFAEQERKILFQGNAEIESETDKLLGEKIEAFLDSEKKHLTSVVATGNASYNAKNADGSRSMKGQTVVFGFDAAGNLKQINAAGQASFASSSPANQQNLEADQIETLFDLNGIPIEINGTSSVRLHINRDKAQIDLSGGRMNARFIAGTGNLERISVFDKATMTAKSALERNELLADVIKIEFRQIENRSSIDTISADGSVKHVYYSAPEAKTPARILSSKTLKMSYSTEGEFLDSGNASGNVIVSEEESGKPNTSQIRKLFADNVRFNFFPQNNQIKKMDADGHVQVNFEKSNESDKALGVDKFKTFSDNLSSVFRLIENKSDIETMTQWGHFSYQDGLRSADSERCNYDAKTGVMHLRESPRIKDATNSTTADLIDFYRDKKMLFASGNVRSRLNSSKSDGNFFGPSGGASSSEVKADQMSYWDEEKRAHYEGKVLFRSEDQQLQSKTLEIFNNGDRVEAMEVSRHLLQPAKKSSDKEGTTTKSKNSLKSGDGPINIKSASMNFKRQENSISYKGNVVMDSDDLHVSAETLDATFDQDGNVKNATARTKVFMRKDTREGMGDTGDWFLEPGKFILIGNPAVVRDLAKGRTFKGRRLTSFTADDTILLENK
jgi:LPS export ABC transporter protein LptC